MIPKYVFDTKQTQLNKINVSVLDRLINYRQLLFNDLLIALNKSYANKEMLINDYKYKVNEVDAHIRKIRFKTYTSKNV